MKCTYLSAIAMPTALEIPWPNGPVDTWNLHMHFYKYNVCDIYICTWILLEVSLLLEINWYLNEVINKYINIYLNSGCDKVFRVTRCYGSYLSESLQIIHTHWTTFKCKFTFIRIYLYVYIYIYIFMYTYAHTYMYVYIYTYEYIYV
jgi:hypothetical protein